MATYAWTRRSFGNQPISNVQTKVPLVSLASGQVIKRVRFDWSFGGLTSTSVNAPMIMTNPVAFGLVTTIGNGSEVVPDPIGSTGDSFPPAQRWIWLESRWPTISAIDSAGCTIAWSGTRPGEEPDTRGEVLAPAGMGVGNSLNLWATFRCFFAWDPSGLGLVSGYCNVLVRTS